MLTVGVTGGIGSGKSAVCRLFSLLGAPVYDSDRRARELMASDARLREDIIALLGPGSYRGGEPDRRWIAGKVFADRELLAGLNALVHPAVFRDLEQWRRRQRAPYVVVESAILFSSGLDALMDRVVVVDAPREVRLERAMRRDGADREAIARRMASQLEAFPRADFTVDNGGEALVWPQVLDMDKQLRT